RAEVESRVAELRLVLSSDVVVVGVPSVEVGAKVKLKEVPPAQPREEPEPQQGVARGSASRRRPPTPPGESLPRQQRGAGQRDGGLDEIHRLAVEEGRQ